MASQQEFADWRRHPVTQEVVRKLTEKNQDAIDRLVSDKAETIETHGLLRLAVQNYVSGLGEFLDLDNLQEVLANDDPS